MKELKEYLHLYLGCEMTVEIIDQEGAHWSKPQTVVLNVYALSELIRHTWRNPKPILRPLIDITEDEKEQIGFPAFEILRKDEFQNIKLPARNLGYVWAAKQTTFLLSKHFDLFGLIESGLAIDATTLKTQNTNQL